MSVDDRLREAFGETDRSWDEQVPAALAAVTARRAARERRTTRGRRRPGRGGRRDGGRRDRVPARRPAPTPCRSDPTTPATTSTTASAEVPRRWTARWLSGPITRADVRRAARAAGRPDAADLMLAGLPATPFRVVLVINGDRHETLQYVRSGGDDELFDQENVECAPTAWCSPPSSPRARTCTPGWSRTACSGWTSSPRPRPEEKACPPRRGSGSSTTPRPSPSER